MLKIRLLIIICLLFIGSNESQSIEYLRTFSPDTSVLTGDTIWITIQITNNEIDTTKGIVFSDQIPSNIEVIDDGIRINTIIYGDYIYEIGYPGEVYTSHIPYRWVFQTPPDFTDTGYLLPGDIATIEYGLTTNIDTSFIFNQDSWYCGFVSTDSLFPLFGFDSINTINISFRNTIPNISPIAVNDLANTIKNTQVNIDILTNDYDPDGILIPSSVIITGEPIHGEAEQNDTTGVVTYTPEYGYFGNDDFFYTVDDNNGLTSNTAGVKINIDSVNIPPIAVNDIDSTYEETPVKIDILSNDSDPNGSLVPSSVIITNEPDRGDVMLNDTTGIVTYLPEYGYHGQDDFHYTVEDNNGSTSNIASVKLNINEGDGSLPVELSVFTVEFRKSAVELKWSTESELNNVGFEIWRMDSIISKFKIISTYLNNHDLQGLGNSSSGKDYEYTDSEIISGHIYYYKLYNIDLDGSKESYGPLKIRIDENIEIPKSFYVSNSYPNPFNPSTKISFDIPDIEDEFSDLSIIIYDLLGRKVKTLYEGQIAPGSYEIKWNGLNDKNQLVPSGIYIYQLISKQQFFESRKMTLIR